MWIFFRSIRLFTKSLVRIAAALEEIRDLYILELATKGIIRTDNKIHDEVEVVYGRQIPRDEEDD